ncbi:hypothetical protein [Hymenobacter convexus]|uniref:hypothetical protein n=1 Tax=Hymenobacter sp. CA1UV-4 TaxID=3063782 RepID=UPI0027139BDB|nr:hypothetical protein [Hymenobacter sp. CA1UV-4]MDO7850754.1 hypothetical protein [Hymenobacter sp. CA1UV-4]
MNITNAGRVGIGNQLLYGSRSMLSVGLGANSLSIDDAGSYRVRSNGNRDYVLGGGACIGFNASRQSDAAFACDPGLLDSYNPNSDSRNGGALIWGDVEGTLNFTAFPSGGGATGINATTTNYWYANEVKAYRVMQIKPTMQVRIGLAAPPATSTHNDYRLAVDGKLVAKSIFVTQATANWADFVFAPTYALQPLPELESYLKQNRHLPAIPSAAEVEKNGIDLGEMNARLLQSLEELTLHVIELGKQNAQLQADMAALKAKVNQAAAPAVSK